MSKFYTKAYYMDLDEGIVLIIERWRNEKFFDFLIKKIKTEPHIKFYRHLTINTNLLIGFNRFSYGNAKVLLNSSGNFDGADMLTFANQVIGNNI